MRYFSEPVTTPVYKVEQKLSKVECDVCGKVIPAGRYGRETRYYEVTTGHHDWGNDSCESVKTIDVCQDCIVGYVADYLYKASETGHIEIEPNHSNRDDTNRKIVNEPPKDDDVTVIDHERW